MSRKDSITVPRTCGAAPPYPLFFPRPTGQRGTRCSFAIRTIAWTSSTVLGLTTPQGTFRGGPGELERILEVREGLGVRGHLVAPDRGGDRGERAVERVLGDAGRDRTVGVEHGFSSSQLGRVCRMAVGRGCTRAGDAA